MVNLLLSRTLEDVKGRAVRALFRLPLGVLRVLAGRPVVIDGKTLDPEMQLILKLQNLEGAASSTATSTTTTPCAGSSPNAPGYASSP